jgi:hypothetical protein
MYFFLMNRKTLVLFSDTFERLAQRGARGVIAAHPVDAAAGWS